MDSEDPRSIRSIAVTPEEVCTALEASYQGSPTVLRVTPPFSGRMRARLHRGTEEYDQSPEPVHLDPGTLVEDPPPYPDPDETEDRLLTDSDIEYTVERHRERHRERVQEWRSAVRDTLVESVELPLSGGSHRVDVVVLG